MPLPAGLTTDVIDAPHGARAALCDRVRPLRRSDMPALVTLYVRVFGMPPTGRLDASAYLERLLFGHPWVDEEVPSMVYEDDDGVPAGLIGVIARPMVWRGRPIRLALGHHFMVAPESRGRLAALELMRGFLGGAQDAAVLEACTPWRRLWEALGGSVAVLPGLWWSRVLGPFRYARGLARGMGLPAAGARALNPIVEAGDRLAARMVPALRLAPPQAATSHPLDPDALVEVMTSAPRQSLRGSFDQASAAWLLGQLRGKTQRGELHGIVLRRSSNAIVGWYLYFLKPRGISQVVALQAGRDQLDTVFDHLASHAFARGAGILAGQANREMIGTLSRRHGLMHQPADTWQLVHSRWPDLLQDIHAGDAAFSRLESDWWITY